MMSSSTIKFHAIKSYELQTVGRETVTWRASLPAAVRRWLEWLRAERRMRRDIQALRALDDRMLDDIGLRRTEIESFARFGRSTDPWCEHTSPLDRPDHR